MNLEQQPLDSRKKILYQNMVQKLLMLFTKGSLKMMIAGLRLSVLIDLHGQILANSSFVLLCIYVFFYANTVFSFFMTKMLHFRYFRMKLNQWGCLEVSGWQIWLVVAVKEMRDCLWHSLCLMKHFQSIYFIVSLTHSFKIWYKHLFHFKIYLLLWII